MTDRPTLKEAEAEQLWPEASAEPSWNSLHPGRDTGLRIVHTVLTDRPASRGNVALFDIDAADLINCALYKVSNIDIKFSRHDNPYS